MKPFSFVSGVLALASVFMMAAQIQAADRMVFAHYMLGNTYGMSISDWNREIQLAKAAAIDGFAMNAGPKDSYGPDQLKNAYQAAETNGFKLFISFDMLCCGDWPVAQVVEWINRHKNSPAQLRIDGRPVVSTFEGPGWAGNWGQVRQETGGIYLIPDWTSLGPHGFKDKLPLVDGGFSWDSWPQTNGRKTPETDRAWMSTLNGKPYMMGVSPWFFTRLPQYSKNWMWGSDQLWFDRWESVIDVLPQFVQIISWNDYGESHYIGPIRAEGVLPAARPYIDNMPHDAWRWILPYYISAYKSGTRNVPISNPGAMFWYRTTPKDVCSDGGTTCGLPASGGGSAKNCVRDSVFVVTASQSDTTVTVSVGGQGQSFNTPRGVRFFEVPLNGRTGSVVVQILGKTGTGPAPISNVCPPSGVVNFNPVVGCT